MRKTQWYIFNETSNTETELTYYHFGATPKFPSWYMEEGNVYTIEMIFSFKLLKTPSLFLKCLFHRFVIKRLDYLL